MTENVAIIPVRATSGHSAQKFFKIPRGPDPYFSGDACFSHLHVGTSFFTIYWGFWVDILGSEKYKRLIYLDSIHLFKSKILGWIHHPEILVWKNNVSLGREGNGRTSIRTLIILSFMIGKIKDDRLFNCV